MDCKVVTFAHFCGIQYFKKKAFERIGKTRCYACSFRKAQEVVIMVLVKKKKKMHDYDVQA